MADEGYGQFGGGGSIEWEIDVQDGHSPSQYVSREDPRVYNLRGTDRHKQDDSGRYFLIQLDQEDIAYSSSDGSTVLIAVRVRPKRGQIRVKWVYDEGEVAGAFGSLKGGSWKMPGGPARSA